MAIGIAGQSYLNVMIDGKQLPLKEMRFQRALVTSHIYYHMPMGELVFVDPYDIVTTNLTIADGTPVTLDIGKDSDRVFRYEMRVFNSNVRKTDEGTFFHLSLIDKWDKWRLTPYKGSLNMTSGEALSTLALACGLTFTGIVTNDRQVWLPMAESHSAFARRIASRGYLDAKSCMTLGVTLAGELRYVNLNGVDLSKPVFEFCHGVQSGIWVTDWRVRSNSGTANQGGGYGTADHQYSTVDTQRTLQNKAQLQRKSNVANINQTSKATAADGRIVMRPIDAGNNHPNAQAAMYQNKRILQLMSTSCSVVTPYDPNLDLLEPILFSNFIANKHEGTIALDAKTSGVHVVAGKTIFIGSDLMYNERYQLIREGHNLDNSTEVS